MTTSTRVEDARRGLPPINDPVVVGARFGRLTILSRNGTLPSGAKAWLCRCDCGTEITTHGPGLRAGNVLSCGCRKKEVLNLRRTTHRMTNSPEYGIWAGIKDRTTNPKCQHFHRYGGRGIVMCDEWRNSFELFYQHMGPRPVGDGFTYSIDRIDNDRGYEPGNCRWATPLEQARNKPSSMAYSTAVAIAAAMIGGGKAKEVAKAFGYSVETVRNIYAGRSWVGAMTDAALRSLSQGAGHEQ